MEENKKVEGNKKGLQIKRRKKEGRSGLETVRDILLYILFVLVVSVILSFIAIKATNDMFAFVKDDKDITIVLHPNASTGEVSKMLFDNGIIEYEILFKIFLDISAKNAVFNEGTHELNSNLDYRGILNELSKSTVESIAAKTVMVTIPEGYTIEQIGALMEEKGVVTYEEFIDTAVNYEFSHTFLTKNEDVLYQLEGYLFPDTYEFYLEDSSVSVINKMLNNFENKTWEIIADMESKNYKYTLHELITIASLIEREAAKADEQETISGVIHNRLNSSSYPYLNIDATIQYAAGHREHILQSDLDADGPYNTYTRAGLPAGPIANSGLDAILASYNPEKHSYYFYVAKSDGYHIFTKNLSEHNAAVASVRNAS